MMGISAPGGEQGQAGDPVVGILDPDHEETYSGNITIRAMVWAASAYTVSVIRNGTEIGTSLPVEFNSTLIADGWYNITVVATDGSSNVGWDTIWILVNNTEVPELPEIQILQRFVKLNTTIHDHTESTMVCEIWFDIEYESAISLLITVTEGNRNSDTIISGYYYPKLNGSTNTHCYVTIPPDSSSTPIVSGTWNVIYYNKQPGTYHLEIWFVHITGFAHDLRHVQTQVTVESFLPKEP